MEKIVKEPHTKSVRSSSCRCAPMCVVSLTCACVPTCECACARVRMYVCVCVGVCVYGKIMKYMLYVSYI